MREQVNIIYTYSSSDCSMREHSSCEEERKLAPSNYKIKLVRLTRELLVVVFFAGSGSFYACSRHECGIIARGNRNVRCTTNPLGSILGHHSLLIKISFIKIVIVLLPLTVVAIVM